MFCKQIKPGHTFWKTGRAFTGRRTSAIGRMLGSLPPFLSQKRCITNRWQWGLGEAQSWKHRELMDVLCEWRVIQFIPQKYYPVNY